MVRFFLIVLTLFFSILCGDAHAQFTHPPPDRPPPVCPVLSGSIEANSGGAHCAENNLFATTLSCYLSGGQVHCAADVKLLVGGVWISLPPIPNRLIYDWAFIVDGQQYYLNPSYENSISFACGYYPYATVRVTAAGKTAFFKVACPGIWDDHPVEPPEFP
jgi:hypothetical protein